MHRPARLSRPLLSIALAVSLPAAAHTDHDADSAIAQALLAAAATPRAAERAGAPFDASAALLAETARYGRWSAVEEWPVLPVHAALLPNGRVMAWDATPDDFDEDVHTTDNYTTRVTVWDPATNTHLGTNNDTDTDLFCAGSAHLWDGRVLFAGGDGGRAGRNGPLSNSNLYDPWTNTWTRTDDLVAPRWYSSVAALGSGEMLTFGGTYTPVPIAERFGLDQRWHPLPITTQYTFSGDYSWLQSTGDGDVMYFGPHDTLSRLDPSGEGRWRAGATRDGAGYRGYGSYAMFDTDRVLVAGGGDSLASAVVVDTRSGTAMPSGAMAYGRRQHNLTVLADGSVLASGGNATGAMHVDRAGGVLAPERWDPASGSWSTLAPARTDRQYHSVALLLPDARVLTGGGGYCAACSEQGYHEQNVEIFSPPYLFAADGTPAVRPRIGALPAVANYGERYRIATPDATSIARAHLIRLGSVTHSQNQEQRLVPLDFTATADALLLDAPMSRELAPPGHYLLFLVDVHGVPSNGEIVQIGQPLMRAGELVVDRLQPARADHFAIEGRGAHTLTLSLYGEVDALDLAVSAGRLPATGAVDGTGFADCVASGQPRDATLCRVSAAGDTTWYVSVDGTSRADYALLARLDTAITSSLPLPGVAAPAAPAAPRLQSIEGRTATLVWQAPAGDEASCRQCIAGYEVHRDGMPIAWHDSLRHVEHSLAPGSNHRFQVVAVYADARRSAPSAALAVTTAPDTFDYAGYYDPDIPSAPTGLHLARYSDTAVELFWEASRDAGAVTGYEVYRDGLLIGIAPGLSYFDDTLVPGESHSYLVIALDDDSNRSAPSNVSGVNLPDPPPEVVAPEDELTGETVTEVPGGYGEGSVGEPAGEMPADDVDADRSGADSVVPPKSTPAPRSASTIERGFGGGGSGIELLGVLGVATVLRRGRVQRRAAPSPGR